MARQISFFDGATSETTPTIGNIVASNLIKYTSDAEYEANEQGAPTEGNIYANTTDHVIRYYDGTEWRTVLFDKVQDNVFHIIGSDDETKEVRFEVDGLTTGTTRVITTIDEDGVMVLEAASQTLTNKTIEVASNTVTTAASGNLTSTELNAALEELQEDIDTREVAANKGIANGYASLDGAGTVPASQLPSYVDDVEEYADLASFPVTGESGKIYIAIDTNFQYRWTGSIYVDITSKVDSVNSQTGVVVLDSDDISEGVTNEYYTEAKVSANASVVANTAKVSADGSIDTHSDVDTTSVAPNIGEILQWDGSNWVPAAGGGSKKLQTKILTTDVVSSGNIGDLTFNNLVIGDWYEVMLQARITLDNGSGDTNVRVDIIHDSTGIGRLEFIVNEGSDTNSDVLTSSTVAKFEATATTVTFDAVSISAGGIVQGNGNREETYAQIMELGDINETTDFT